MEDDLHIISFESNCIYLSLCVCGSGQLGLCLLLVNCGPGFKELNIDGASSADRTFHSLVRVVFFLLFCVDVFKAADSLSYVLAALADGIPGKWDSIGIYLGLPYKVIERCRLEDTLDEKIRSMVIAWVRGKYDVEKFGQPSWRKLVEAIAHKSGGYNKRLATNLAPKHPVMSSEGKTQVYVMTYLKVAGIERWPLSV